MPGETRLIISCEHGGNLIPPEFHELFFGLEKLLKSHRSYDPGAVELAERLAVSLRCPLIVNPISRLLVEVNRSLRHPRLFSEFTSKLPDHVKDDILSRFYFPHRNRVQVLSKSMIREGFLVLHLALHSFTPILEREIRTADLGLLYDPSRRREADFCCSWKQLLEDFRPDLRVRRNYPYLGKSDGMTAHLRRVLPPPSYLGIEVEINQKHPLGPTTDWIGVQEWVHGSLRELIGSTSRSGEFAPFSP